MENDETKRLLQSIGKIIAEDKEYPVEDTLLHVVLDHNMVEPSIFKDLGNSIFYRWPDTRQLGSALLDLWEAQDTDDRWAEMAYVLRNGTFTVHYVFPDAIDPEEEPLDRRARVVREHFGDKPIVYPPFPPDDDVPVYALDRDPG